MSPAAARTTAWRLVGGVVVLTSATPLAAAAGAAAVDGPAGPAWWAAPLLVGFAGAYAAALVAVVVGRRPDPAAAAMVLLGLAALLSQAVLVQLGVARQLLPGGHSTWPTYLAVAAVQTAAVLLRRVPQGWALAATAAVSAVVAAAGPLPPALPPGTGGRVLYAVVLALVASAVQYLARGLERVSGRLGSARGAVLRADAEAEAMALAEAERGRWEAAVHDDVLSALRAGAAARTPEEVSGAAAAATAALASIAAPPATLTVVAALAAAQVGAAARGAHGDVEVELTSGSGALPGRVVEALADATAELMRNTAHHNPPGVRARVRGHLDAGGAHVVVSDDGTGFDPDRLPAGRLGIRVSVVGRLRSVGGEAVVTSGPRRGTSVELRWPR
ncbi:ATP-binding protein [Quadrisphaera sp. KR29]|uniref:ATP-binding protein n=1 Tax=Quadrisphaera sp. KR29 TaxID=3461391 RepID=UPI004045009F